MKHTDNYYIKRILKNLHLDKIKNDENEYIMNSSRTTPTERGVKIEHKKKINWKWETITTIERTSREQLYNETEYYKDYLI